MPADTSQAAPPRGNLAPALCLGAVWLVMCLAVHPAGEFPLNDDWVYALAVRSILATGQFALPSPSSANVIVQAYWGALFCLPFGFSFTALRLSTLVLGGAGVLALFLLLRELGAARAIALAGALTLAVNPVYFGLSASFMTDVPFTALLTLSLLLYLRGAAQDQAVLIATAIAIAFAATFIRQFGLILLFGYAAAQLARKGGNPRSLALAILPLAFGIALQVAYDHWLIAARRTPKIPAPLHHLLPGSYAALALHIEWVVWMFLPYIGLFIAPFAACVLAARRRLPQPLLFWSLIALLTLLALARLAASGVFMPALGNVLTITGLGPRTLRDTYLLAINRAPVPNAIIWFWIIANIPCIGAAIYVLLSTLRSPALSAIFRDPRGSWRMVLMLAIAGPYFAALLVVSDSAPFFDRYFLPLIPLLCAILLMTHSQDFASPGSIRHLAPSALLLALYAAFTIPADHDYLAYNRARWQATARLNASGITPSHIDGGYEYNGWNLHDPNYRETPDKSYWWVEDNTYIIAAGPLPGYQQFASVKISRWLPVGQRDIIILQRK